MADGAASEWRFAPASEADFEPLLAIRIDVMREHLERVFRYEPSRARRVFREHFDQPGLRLILIGDMPTPSDVLVLGFKDPDGNWGVSFHGTFVDLPGGSFSDALIRFQVEVDAEAAEAGWLISDAHLFIGGVGAGDESFLTVDETFLGKNETLNAYYSTIGPGVNSQLSDSTIFTTPVTKLNVTKDIFASAAAGGFLPARATVIDQSFSQTLIPEPATLALAGMSGLAMAAIGAFFSSFFGAGEIGRAHV